MSFCGLIKEISPTICILCVRVKISVRLNLLVFGSCFRTLAVILFQISFLNDQGLRAEEDSSARVKNMAAKVHCSGKGNALRA